MSLIFKQLRATKHKSEVLTTGLAALAATTLYDLTTFLKGHKMRGASDNYGPFIFFTTYLRWMRN